MKETFLYTLLLNKYKKYTDFLQNIQQVWFIYFWRAKKMGQSSPYYFVLKNRIVQKCRRLSCCTSPPVRFHYNYQDLPIS